MPIGEFFRGLIGKKKNPVSVKSETVLEDVGQPISPVNETGAESKENQVELEFIYKILETFQGTHLQKVIQACELYGMFDRVDTDVERAKKILYLPPGDPVHTSFFQFQLQIGEYLKKERFFALAKEERTIHSRQYRFKYDSAGKCVDVCDDTFGETIQYVPLYVYDVFQHLTELIRIEKDAKFLAMQNGKKYTELTVDFEFIRSQLSTFINVWERVIEQLHGYLMSDSRLCSDYQLIVSHYAQNLMREALVDELKRKEMNQVSQNLNIGEVPRELHNLLQNANHDQVLPLDGSFMQLLIRKWKAFGPLGIFYLRYVLKDRLFWDRDELEVREATEDLTKFPEVQKDLRYEEYLRAAVSLRLAREGLSPITVQLFEHLYRDWGAGRESLSVFLLKEMIFHSEKWSGNDLLKYIFQFQDRVKNEELQSFIDSHKHLVCLLYETYPVDSVRGWDLLGSKWIEDLADALTPKEIMEFFDALETILSNYAEFSGVQTYTKMVLPSGSIPTDKPSYIGSWIEVDPVEKKTREATVTVFGSIIPFDKIIDNPGKINRLYRGYQTYIYDLVENNKQKNALDLRSKTWIKIAKRVIQELAKRITQQQPSFDTLAVSLGYDSQQLTQEQKNQICYLHQLSQIRLVLLDIISEIEIADDNDVILEPYDIELDEGRA